MDGFFKVLGIVGLLSVKLQEASIDGKITISEAIGIMEAICESLGINFDKEGFDFEPIQPIEDL